MQLTLWFIGIGSLLIAMSIGSGIARLHAESAILYFAFGVALGPWGLDWLTIDRRSFGRDRRFTQFASSCCLRRDQPGRDAARTTLGVPIRLASVAMFVSAALSAFCGALEMSGASVLLAAILAPTDRSGGRRAGRGPGGPRPFAIRTHR
jgi:hypothetical protein